jgi:hypothetical protein
MKAIKLSIISAGIIGLFSMSQVQANGFFNVDKTMDYQAKQSFDASRHQGTEFWSNFEGIPSESPKKSEQVASFDKSKHVGTKFWDYYYN